MTKAELVKAVAKRNGYDKETVSRILSDILNEIKDNVRVGNNVYMRGFGSFITKIRKEKKARDIKTNTTIVVPEHKVVAFKPAPDFGDNL